jgi:hypothetical protein
MGRKGYKGIAAVAEDLYVINDDGDHVIRMCEVRPGAVECKVMIIAGQPGLNGNVDHEHGCSALLSRPGRSFFSFHLYHTSPNFFNAESKLISSTKNVISAPEPLKIFVCCLWRAPSPSPPSQLTSKRSFLLQIWISIEFW